MPLIYKGDLPALPLSWESWVRNPDGRVESLLRPAGHAALSDLAFPFDGEAVDPFDNVCFVLPKRVFSDFRDMLELAEFHLSERCFRVEQDEILTGLAKTALPALDRPWEANKLFVDHLCALIGLHLVRRFGGRSKLPPADSRRGSLLIGAGSRRRSASQAIDLLGDGGVTLGL